MESTQLILTYTFNVTFYTFSVLFIFEFLFGFSQQEFQLFTTPVQPILPDHSVLRLEEVNSQVEKLTFEQVHVEFAGKGFIFERAKSGHHRYKVTPLTGSSYRFKTLQQALDWLNINKQSMQINITNYG